ncbi:peptidylprolyl isomerase [Paraflavisolibacter sp. H34]|uniref:peptidylprolyl isomerase n=1 Tax=Huijunlia imazamoxiresistens TaxID=3127457 RepID=UPI00301A6F66
MKKAFLVLSGFLGLASLASAQGQKVVADKIVGIVGDRIILHSDIKNTIADAARQGGTVPENAECMILEQALISKIMMLQAEKDSLPVTDDEVEADLDLRVREFIRQYGTQQALEDIAGKTIYQIKDDARESVKERKLAEAEQRKIVENVKITPTEVKDFFDKIPKDSLPYYESEFEIGQIVVYPKASRDLEKYVIDELNTYRKQVEMKVASFGDLAKRYSEDPGSKDRGGQYQVNRNEKSWDPAFLSGAFRLKEGEVSPVIKSKFGYHIIQMVSKTGDDAIVRHILRIPPVTDEETRESISKLDSVRAKLIAGTTTFPVAAGKYSEDEAAKYSGPYITGRDGSSFVTIDQLDKDLVALLDKLKVGEYSQPQAYADERGKKAVRLVFLKSRTEPHRMNLRDDYNRIAQYALEQKKQAALEKWITAKLPSYYIMIDPASAAGCEQLQKWSSLQAQTK